MTISKLATYTKLTANHSGKRTQPVSKITIHYMADNGAFTGKGCADYFYNCGLSGRQASSNYCIGGGGDIACSVDEANRSWCSSSDWNDQRAVTIEVSTINNSTGEITKEAWNAMINLCADICERYNFRLEYNGSKSGSLTEHRMFAATDCPGAYLHSRMSQIAKEVNAKLDAKKKVIVPVTKNAVYRLFHKEHFYTANVKEAQSLVDSGWQYEGVGWVSPDKGIPVHRLYNPTTGFHHFTVTVNEKDYLQKAGWKYEGVAFNANQSGAPIYRVYNCNNGDHLLTASKTEYTAVVKAGWSDEKVAFYI